jgi:hypothetical protein
LTRSLRVRSRVKVFGGEGAGGFDGAGVLVAQRVKAGGGLVSIVRHLLDQRKAAKALEPCAQLEFQSTVDPFL